MTRPTWGVSLAIVCGMALVGGLAAWRHDPAATATDPSEPPRPIASAAEENQAAQPVIPAELKIESPLDLTPAEYLLCWKGLPHPDAEAMLDQPSSMQTLLELAGRIWSDRLDETQKLSMRILETLGIVGHYPFAVTLIDATAKPIREDGSGAKLDELRIAVIVQTGDLDASKPFLGIIQKAINELTDAGAATLASRRAHKWDYQILADTRLPKWCEIAWGQIDEHFVITFGQGVWPLVASTAVGESESIARVKWVSQIRRQSQDEPLIEVMVAADKIRRRLDPFVGDRATAFFKAWRIDDVEHMHWSLGFKGRALYCLAYFREGRTSKRRLFANPHIRNERFLQTAPGESRYAIYKLQVKTFLPKLISSYYATRDPEDRAAAAAAWRKIQDELGIDAERDVLAHLGDHIIAHNYPSHPFNVPLAFTSLIEIKGEPNTVRRTLEKLLEGWQEMLDQQASETGKLCPVRIRRDDDGVWHVEFFLIHGIAWTFTDRYIVTSWSPVALRDYLETIGDKIGKRD